MRHFCSIFVVLAAALFVMFKLTDGQPIGANQERAKEKFFVLHQTLTQAPISINDLISLFQQFHFDSAQEEGQGRQLKLTAEREND